jgi:hypothetical protein
MPKKENNAIRMRVQIKILTPNNFLIVKLIFWISYVEYAMDHIHYIRLSKIWKLQLLVKFSGKDFCDTFVNGTIRVV